VRWKPEEGTLHHPSAWGPLEEPRYERERFGDVKARTEVENLLRTGKGIGHRILKGIRTNYE